MKMRFALARLFLVLAIFSLLLAVDAMADKPAWCNDDCETVHVHCLADVSDECDGAAACTDSSSCDLYMTTDMCAVYGLPPGEYDEDMDDIWDDHMDGDQCSGLGIGDVNIEACCLGIHELTHLCTTSNPMPCGEDSALFEERACMYDIIDEYCDGNEPPGQARTQCTGFCGTALTTSATMYWDRCWCYQFLDDEFPISYHPPQDCCDCIDECADEENYMPEVCDNYELGSGQNPSDECQNIAETSEHSCDYWRKMAWPWIGWWPWEFSVEDACDYEMECTEVVIKAGQGTYEQGDTCSEDEDCINCEDNKVYEGTCDFNGYYYTCNYNNPTGCEKDCGAECCDDDDCIGRPMDPSCTLVDKECDLDTCLCDYEIDCPCPEGYETCDYALWEDCFPKPMTSTCNPTVQELTQALWSEVGERFCTDTYGPDTLIDFKVMYYEAPRECCGAACCDEDQNCFDDPCYSYQGPRGIGQACCKCDTGEPPGPPGGGEGMP